MIKLIYYKGMKNKDKPFKLLKKLVVNDQIEFHSESGGLTSKEIEKEFANDKDLDDLIGTLDSFGFNGYSGYEYVIDVLLSALNSKKK